MSTFQCSHCGQIFIDGEEQEFDEDSTNAFLEENGDVESGYCGCDS